MFVPPRPPPFLSPKDYDFVKSENLGLNRARRLGGEYSSNIFMHIQVRFGVHSTLQLLYGGCIVILTSIASNFVKFYINTYSTFQGAVQIVFS